MYPCIILCGGFATRLGELALRTPKCLLEVNEKPFLYYQLKNLEKQGLREVYLSVGHLSEEICTFIQRNNFVNLDITLVDDGAAPLGTGGAVKKIITMIQSPAFVMYGDSFLRVNFSNVYKIYRPEMGPLMVIFKNDGKYDRSNVCVKGDHIYYDKTNVNPSADHIDYGLGIWKPLDFVSTPDCFDLGRAQEHFSKLNLLQSYLAEKRFYEIGTPATYEETKEFFKDNESFQLY